MRIGPLRNGRLFPSPDVTILDMRRRLSSLRRHPLYEHYLELVGVAVILTCTAAVAVYTREQMMWLCAVFFAGVTGLAGLAIKWRNDQIRREYPQSHGLCMKCGYDLRETADRCRECGTMPKFQFTTRPATELGVIE